MLKTAARTAQPPVDFVSRTAARINLIEGKLRDQFLLHRQERLGLAVFDLTSDSWLGAINADTAFQTGSMIKLMFACAATIKEPNCFNRNDQPFKQLRNDITEMLARSDNAAANRVLQFVGGPKEAQRILSRNFSHIFSDVQITAEIPIDGRQYNNTCSPADCVRTLRALWRSELPASEKLLEILKISPKTRLAGYQPDLILPERNSVVAHKTGSTSRVCCESAVIIPSGLGRAYILSAIIDQEKPAFSLEGWLAVKEKALGTISADVFDMLKRFGQIVAA